MILRFCLAFSVLIATTTVWAQTPSMVISRPLAEIVEAARGTASASVVSRNDSVLAAQVNAPVLRVHADAGASVQRGALLIELDPADQKLLLAQADAALASARARLVQAEQRLLRGQSMDAKSLISADDLLALATAKQAAAAELQSAEASRAMAARNLDKCRVLAPFDGSVLERMAQVGAMASLGAPLIRLIEVGDSEVEARLPATEAAQLADGSEHAFEIDARRYPLRLLRLGEAVDAASRTQVARFAFVDAQANPGSSGRLHWRLAGGQLPATLLVKRGEQRGIFAVDAGKARFLALPDAQDGRPVSVASLDPALRIVVEGQQSLNDGDSVGERSR